MGLRDIFRIGEFKQQIQDLTNQLAEQKLILMRWDLQNMSKYRKP